MSAALGMLAALTLGDVPLRPSLELRAAPPTVKPATTEESQ